MSWWEKSMIYASFMCRCMLQIHSGIFLEYQPSFRLWDKSFQTQNPKVGSHYLKKKVERKP